MLLHDPSGMSRKPFLNDKKVWFPLTGKAAWLDRKLPLVYLWGSATINQQLTMISVFTT